MYSGYYCKKCKTIPMIKLLLEKKDKIKYIIKCKCHIKNSTQSQINKHYYYENINKNLIVNEKEIQHNQYNDLLINELKNNINIVKQNNESLITIKQEIANYINNILKEIDQLMYQIEQYLQFSEILIKAYESYPSNFSNIINIKNIFNNEEYFNENKYDVSHGNFFKDEDKYGEIEEEDLIKIKKLGRRYLISFNLQNCNIYRRIGKIKIINYEDDWEDYYIPERTKFRVKIVNLI